jgi:hypothetical protein
MPITFLNLAMLAGLVAVLIPPIIHLLNRKRYDVVPWGAMQFLQVSERTRRKVFLEEVLLMLVRMGLIGLMVVALAAPLDASRWLDFLADHGRRDVVLVVDGSASMAYRGPTATAHDAAKAWALALLDDLGSGDGVAVIGARHRPQVLVPEPTHDFDLVRTAIQTLPAPRGGCDGPAAVQAAVQALKASTAARREVIVLTDRQRHGWADDAAMPGWELVGGQAGDGGPRVWLVNLDPDRPADPPNRSLAPLRASRAVASAGQEVAFRTALERHGAGDLPPPGRLRLLIDGKPAGDLPPPTATGEKGQMPFTIRHRFASAGSHLMTVQAEPDAVPGDDRQDFALEVLPQLPVLLVDGDPNPAATRRGADFLRDALAPARDPHPAVLARVVSVAEFDPVLLTRDLAGPGTVPRVVALCNVAKLTAPRQAAIASFLEAGGGVLVAPGDRADARSYDEELHRGGRGWLPAALAEPVGDVSDPAKAAQPLPATFFHPALELFREPQPGGLVDARFPRHWRLTVPAGGSAVAVARLTGDAPFLVEKPVGAGRVLKTCVPLDNSWRTNVVELPAFAPLAHELVYYLAGARSAALNLTPGQPLRFRLPKDAPKAGWALQPPDGPERPVALTEGQIVVEDTSEPGVYTLRHAASGAVRYAVVQSDARESDLAPWTDADRERVRQYVPGLEFNDDRKAIVSGILRAPQPAELWWACMAGVVGLLAVEVWLTRRRALAARLP